MKLSDKELTVAVERKIISQEQLHNLVEFKKSNYNNNTALLVLYYFGAGLIISALTWLMADGWMNYGTTAVALLSFAYMLAFLITAIILKKKDNFQILSGLLFCVVVSIVPLFMFSILDLFGYWDTSDYDSFWIWIKGKWVVLEIAGILVALTIFYFVRFPMLIALVAFGLWFFSMDVVPIIMKSNYFTWEDRAEVSLVFGIVILVLGYITDKKFGKEFAFWLYLFSSLSLISSISYFHFGNDEFYSYFFLFLFSVILVCLFIYLQQKVFLVFAIFGFVELLGNLAYEYSDSPIFTFLLTAAGIGLIIMGIKYQKFIVNRFKKSARQNELPQKTDAGDNH